MYSRCLYSSSQNTRKQYLVNVCCKIYHLCVSMHVNIGSYMSIPLDNLYHYIEQICQQIWQGRVIIYRFYPHGSKDFAHLETLYVGYSLSDTVLCPAVICNDQEPLNYELYERATLMFESGKNILNRLGYTKQNLRDYPIEVWDHAVILHSEQRSTDVEQYQQDGFVPAYYWSHAIIARDWFRFAEHVKQQKQVQKRFLIYNRAWTGTREYRLKFVEHLIDWQLTNDCRTSANAVDPDSGLHYRDYTFANPVWCPTQDIDRSFPANTNCSTSSAKFDLHDYEVTDIEVVLETLFDDARLHLTEKSLRPIALAQPFILVGTAGSLEYLRRYGFRTFDGIWSEDYDTVQDSAQRLERIVCVMKIIADWDSVTRQQKMQQAQAIADYNRQHFFSAEFFDLVRHELTHNLSQAFDQVQQKQTGHTWFGFRPDSKDLLPVFDKHETTNPSAEEWNHIVQQAQAHCRDFAKS